MKLLYYFINKVLILCNSKYSSKKFWYLVESKKSKDHNDLGLGFYGTLKWRDGVMQTDAKVIYSIPLPSK